MTELLVARHGQIVSLLQTRDDHLPTPVRRDYTAVGFVHNDLARVSCPDCLANDRPMAGCETCRGRGFVEELRERDPYAIDKPTPYGLDATRHDRGYARNAEITRLAQQTRVFQTAADELADANAHPYGWEVARRQMWRQHDYAALDRAVELLRARDEVGCRLIHAVYVYGWLDHSPVVAVVLDRALSFIDVRMPDPIRAPGTTAPAVAKESLWRGKSDKHRAARELRAVRVRRAHVEWGWSTGEIAAHESLSERRVRQLLAGDAGTEAQIASGPAA